MVRVDRKCEAYVSECGSVDVEWKRQGERRRRV